VYNTNQIVAARTRACCDIHAHPKRHAALPARLRAKGAKGADVT
jgi:hypothetical protein